jgi:hypothetical protein
VTLFRETGAFAKKLKPGMTAKLALTGGDRQAVGEPIDVKLTAAKMQGVLGKVTITTSAAIPTGMEPTAVIRLIAPSAFE